MAQLITPQGGYSPAAQGVQNMSDTLASITGSPATGAYLAAAQAGPNYAGNTAISQGMSEEDKLRTMFAQDQVLAQKYMNPNLYGGSATPPTDNPAGQFASPLQATIDSITNSQGITSPGALIGAIGGDVSGQKSTLGDVMNAIDFGQGRTLDAYKSMMNALSTIYQTESQYGTGIGGLGLLPAVGSGTDALSLRKQYQQIYNSTSNFNVRDKIAKDFKTSTGYDLFPAKLSTSEQNTVNNTNKILTDLNWLKNTINSGLLDKYMGILGGNYADLLSNPKTASLLPDDVHKALRILTQFKVLGERTAVGGRITGYLLDKLGPGFPDLAQGKNKVLSAIDDAIENGTTNIESLATQKGYMNLNEFPYYKIGSTSVDESGGLNQSKNQTNDPLGIR